MSFAIGGTKATEVAIGGVKITKGAIGGVKFSSTPATPDQPGTLTLTTERPRRGAVINYTIADPNGISAVTSVIMEASDGTVSDVTDQISRTDANTFGGRSNRGNNKWRAASISITYTDATSGASHTLRRSWSI